MPTSALRQIQNPRTWGFDHAMDHRPWIGVWENERTGYTEIPYWVGQFYGDDQHDTPQWRLLHQQAHWDTTGQPSDPIGPFGPPVGQNLWWTGPTGPHAKWWIWTNQMEHFLVAQNMAENQWELYYPFW